MGDIVLTEGLNELNVQMVPTAPPSVLRVFGMVTEAETGLPIADAHLLLVDAIRGLLVADAYTGTDGKYLIDYTPWRSYKFTIHPEKAGYELPVPYYTHYILGTEGVFEHNFEMVPVPMPPPGLEPLSEEWWIKFGECLQKAYGAFQEYEGYITNGVGLAMCMSEKDLPLPPYGWQTTDITWRNTWGAALCQCGTDHPEYLGPYGFNPAWWNASTCGGMCAFCYGVAGI